MSHILETLWRNQIIDSKTIFKARFFSKDFQGVSYEKADDFFPTDVVVVSQEVKVNLHGCYADNVIVATASDIISINGMSPERFVNVFNLNWDGSNKYLGKKRGRRRKINP